MLDESNVEGLNVHEQKKGSFIDIYDPRHWNNLDNNMEDLLVEKRFKKEMNLVFPLYKSSRWFSYAYDSKLSNGEISDRNWLVYSKHEDICCCFCGKFFKSNVFLSSLANEKSKEWKHLSERIIYHDKKVDHMTNMKTWNVLKFRMEKI